MIRLSNGPQMLRDAFGAIVEGLSRPFGLLLLFLTFLHQFVVADAPLRLFPERAHDRLLLSEENLGNPQMFPFEDLRTKKTWERCLCPPIDWDHNFRKERSMELSGKKIAILATNGF